MCEVERDDVDSAPSSGRLHGAEPEKLLAPVSEPYPAVTSSVLLRSIQTHGLLRLTDSLDGKQRKVSVM